MQHVLGEGMYTEIWQVNLKEKNNCIGGKILLQWMGGYGLDSFGSRQGQVVSSCEYGNELPGFFTS